MAAVVSGVLHAVALVLLLVRWEITPLPQPEPPIEVEMIQTPAMVQGVAAPPPTPPQPEPPPPQAGESAAPSVPPPPPQQPNVNIGNGPEQSDPLVVTGDNIVPPAPDSRFRNQPPGYPAAAARVGAEGTVHLMIRVSALGIPMEVRVVETSGNGSLDAAARHAVQLWRFKPAMQDGRPVAFDYLLNIHFAIGDHP